MPAHVFGNGQRLYLAQFELSQFAKAFAMQTTVDTEDVTVIASTTRVGAPGLRSAGWNAELFFDAPVDAALDALMDSASAVGGMGDGTAALMSFMPNGATEGQVAFFQRSMLSEANRPMAVGSAFMRSLSGLAFDGVRGGSAGLMVRGQCSAARTVTGAGNGTAVLLGVVAAGEQIHMGAHVTAMSGTTPSFQLVVQSDDNAGFTSPTVRATATAVTGVGAIDIPPIVGPIAADNYWRVVWTLTGTTPSVSFVASVARTLRSI